MLVEKQCLSLSQSLVQELLTNYGSPLYVYQGDRLRQNILQITQAVPYPKTRFHFASVTNGNDALLYVTDVCENKTYSRDYLGRNCQLPKLSVGDVIAILDTGAYGYAMSSHFLHRPRPAEVLIENGTHRLIRKREEYSVLLSGQVFEG